MEKYGWEQAVDLSTPDFICRVSSELEEGLSLNREENVNAFVESFDGDQYEHGDIS